MLCAYRFLQYDAGTSTILGGPISPQGPAPRAMSAVTHARLSSPLVTVQEGREKIAYKDRALHTTYEAQTTQPYPPHPLLLRGIRSLHATSASSIYINTICNDSPRALSQKLYLHSFASNPSHFSPCSLYLVKMAPVACLPPKRLPRVSRWVPQSPYLPST